MAKNFWLCSLHAKNGGLIYSVGQLLFKKSHIIDLLTFIAYSKQYTSRLVSKIGRFYLENYVFAWSKGFSDRCTQQEA